MDAKRHPRKIPAHGEHVASTAAFRLAKTRRLTRALRRLVPGSLLLLTACRAREAQTPSDAVLQLYTVREALGVQGAPDAAELRALAPFLADTLTQSLARADARRTTDRQRAPDEKPAFVEGDLFSSLFEGATSFRVMPALDSGAVTRVPVEFTSDRERPAVRWVDTVEVIRERDRFVVRDVRYGGGWDFAQHGTLLDLLTGAR